MRNSLLVTFLFVLGFAPEAHTQIEETKDEKAANWSNVAGASFVLTSGNALTSSMALDNQTTYTLDNSELQVSLGALRTRTAAERFAVGTQDNFEAINDPKRVLDNERYYVLGKYQRNISENFFWMTGAGWDRDMNAGIHDREVLFLGVGNTWTNTEETKLKTEYAVTFTRRIDALPDPLRNEKFSEIRLALDYFQLVRGNNQFEIDFVYFLNVNQVNDFRFDSTNLFTSKFSSMFALRVSLQFLFQNLPALEQLDLFNLQRVSLGTAVVRKRKLDSIFKFSFVITL